MSGIDSFTKLLLHMDGADGATTFTDSSLSPRVVTPSGNAQIDTAQSKFGSASGLFDGSGDFLTVATSSDMVFTADCAVDFWIRPNAVGTTKTLFTWSGGGDAFQILLTASAKLQWADTFSHTRTSTTTLSAGVWYHAAVTRVSGVLRLFLNGTQEDTNFSTSATYGSTSFTPKISQTGASSLNGWLDEFRISTGDGRWSANFTPATEAYAEVVVPSEDRASARAALFRRGSSNYWPGKSAS